MPIEILVAGTSRSFPGGEAGMRGSDAAANGLVVIGADVRHAYAARQPSSHAFVAIELGTECLAVHVGLEPSEAHSRTVGFARFRLGDADPTNLIELVRQPWTEASAVAAARAAFESLGLVVALCEDFPGRIVDRLIRPYLNAVLRRLDEGLASAADLDTTLRLGLGYPEGPVALLDRTGLHHHHDITQALFESLGDPDYAPARRAQVAKARVP